MNFLNFLTSGAGVFNFNLQNLSLNSSSNSLLRPTQIISPQNKDEEEEFEPQQIAPEQEVADPNRVFERILTNNQAELLNQHQQLINQYMHLNIQLLSQKIQSLQQQPEKKEEPSSTDVKTNKKKIKKVNIHCGHNQREHYAKGMCNNCYHKNGRTKKPWKCEHEKLYANGLCQNCYINKYNRMKRQKNQPQSEQLNLQDFQSKPQQSQAKMEQAQ